MRYRLLPYYTVTAPKACDTSVSRFSLALHPGGTPSNGLHGEAPPEKGTFFGLQVKKREGFHKLRYIKGQGNFDVRNILTPVHNMN